MKQICSRFEACQQSVRDGMYNSFVNGCAVLRVMFTECTMLLGLCREASTHEVFLLSCVALANMSLLEPTTCDFLSLNSTVAVLVDASYRHTAHSLFAKDQARLLAV